MRKLNKLVNHLISLGGKEKEGKIYITGIWEELLQAKTGVNSLQIAGNEFVQFGNDPRANERTRRTVLQFVNNMAYVYLDVKSGEFKGMAKNTGIEFKPEYGNLAVWINGKVFKVYLF